MIAGAAKHCSISDRDLFAVVNGFAVRAAARLFSDSCGHQAHSSIRHCLGLRQMVDEKFVG